MYESYFGLTCRPFDLAPDPKFLFETEQHSRAANNIRFALMNHDSFVAISGGIGTGKTTVLNTALRDLGPKFITARVVHTTLTGVELLQALLSEFGIPNYGDKKVQLLDEIRRYFLEQHQAGKHVVIIVDEAQHLSPGLVEELRLLTCIDSQDRRIVTIVLTGQPSLDEVLDDESLSQLRQRMRLRQRLRPLEPADTVAYIKHRLSIAGGDISKLFAPNTLSEIHRLTMGTPRLINTLCDMSLVACMVASLQQVDMATLERVVEELGWRWDRGSGRRKQDPGEIRAAQAPAERASLMVHHPGARVARIEVDALPFTIGRSGGNSLVVDTKDVSRQHAMIDRIGSRYVLEDLNSLNGVYVNGTRVTSVQLKPGDIIGLGQATLVFGMQRDVGEETADFVGVRSAQAAVGDN